MQKVQESIVKIFIARTFNKKTKCMISRSFNLKVTVISRRQKNSSRQKRGSVEVLYCPRYLATAAESSAQSEKKRCTCERQSLPSSRGYSPNRCIEQIDRFPRSTQSDGGQGVILLQLSQCTGGWWRCVDGVERTRRRRKRWRRRVLRGLWTRSIMHLLAGVVPLSHSEGDRTCEERYSSF